MFIQRSAILPASFRRFLSLRPNIGAGKRVYAIGDIHGSAKLLDQLMRRIMEDIELTAPHRVGFVFLGDYVDRGVETAKVLRRLVQFRNNDMIDARFIMGNHERMLLDFLDDPVRNEAWLRFGGVETLHSFGIEEAAKGMLKEERIVVADTLERAMGETLDFLTHDLDPFIRCGNVFFCHAAVDRMAPPDQQDEKTLLWGSKDFLTQGGFDDLFVVHGHTPRPEPDWGYNRLGVDTGAYYSRRLTAARIEDDSVEFIAARASR